MIFIISFYKSQAFKYTIDRYTKNYPSIVNKVRLSEIIYIHLLRKSRINSLLVKIQYCLLYSNFTCPFNYTERKIFHSDNENGSLKILHYMNVKFHIYNISTFVF